LTIGRKPQKTNSLHHHGPAASFIMTTIGWVHEFDQFEEACHRKGLVVKVNAIELQKVELIILPWLDATI